MTTLRDSRPSIFDGCANAFAEVYGGKPHHQTPEPTPSMKRIRTEIYISVRTYIGDDVGEEEMPLTRTANAGTAVDVATVEEATTFTNHEIAAAQVMRLLKDAVAPIPEAVRKAIYRKETFKLPPLTS